MIGFIVIFDAAGDYTVHWCTHTHTYTLVFIVTSSLAVVGSGFQWRTFPFPWISELSPASATTLSQQQLRKTELQPFSNSLTQSLTNQPAELKWLSLSVLLIASRHRPHRKQRIITAEESCLFAKPLLSNGCCTADSFDVDASNGSTRHNVYLLLP
jgi:hypothetical protein